MRLLSKETVVARHAKALGCLREWPFIGFCVGCPFEQSCPVPRAPLLLWTMRIDQANGRAEANSYLNSLTTADLSEAARNLHGLGVSYRTTSIHMRCGDILLSQDPKEVEYTLKPTMNLHEMHNPGKDTCQKRIIMDSRQVKFNQITYYGRKTILAVQVCSKDCAIRLADSVNSNWRSVMNLVREIRPLRTFK